MNAVDTVKALMVGEEHVRHDESKQWCVKYRTALMELAIELDAARERIFVLEHANPERWRREHLDTAALLRNKPPVEQPRLSKAEAQSKRMKEYWARRKGLTK